LVDTVSGAVFGPRFFLTVAYQCPSVVPASAEFRLNKKIGKLGKVPGLGFPFFPASLFKFGGGSVPRQITCGQESPESNPNISHPEV
jgi:hypothetical protein